MAKEGQSITLNQEQHKAFMDYLATTRHPERDTLIYLLTYRAGMRIGTIAQLKIGDILDTSNNVKQVITLRKSITKGSKTTMAYISHPELQESIVEYVKLLESKGKRGRVQAASNLFLTQKGYPLSPNVASQIMLKHYNKAGFEGSSSHQGRAGFATNCLKKGMDIVAVSKLMSHTSLNTTMRYIRHDQEELSNMVAKL